MFYNSFLVFLTGFKKRWFCYQKQHNYKTRFRNENYRNMKDLWSNIGKIGNDVNVTSSWLTPSIVFEGVDFRSPTQPSASWGGEE
jgi:hypothetical protein